MTYVWFNQVQLTFMVVKIGIILVTMVGRAVVA